MSPAALTLFVTAFVGGLALLAQVARKSRGAEVTLIVVLLVLSLLVAALGAFTGVGLLLRAASGGGPGLGRPGLGAGGGGWERKPLDSRSPHIPYCVSLLRK